MAESFRLEDKNIADFLAMSRKSKLTPYEDKAIKSFDKVLGPSANSLTLWGGVEKWMVALHDKHHSKSTRLRYFQSLKSAYSRIMNCQLDSLKYSDSVDEKVSIEKLSSLLRTMSLGLGKALSVDISQRPANLGRFHLTSSVLIAMVYLGGMDIERIITLSKHDVLFSIMPPQCKDICDIWASAARKYIFPLEQGQKSLNKTIAQEWEHIKALPVKVGDKVFFQSLVENRELAVSLWANFAMHAGVSDEDIRSVIPFIPATHPWLNQISARPINDKKRKAILNRVACYIQPGRRNWYAMGLRGTATPEQIANVLSQHGIELKTFFPVYEIKKRIGKKLKKSLVPYISHVLFFNCRENEIGPVFKHILNYAWPYNYGSGTNRRCMEIHDMDRFQRAINNLTKDVEIQIITPNDIKKGDKVKIVGGIFNEYQGEVNVNAKRDTDTVVIKIPNGNKHVLIEVSPYSVQIL